VYHACDDREHPTYTELGRRIGGAIGRGVLVVKLPATAAYPIVAAIEGFWNLLGQGSIVSPDKLREATARSWASSAAKARSQLQFTPSAPLDDRLRDTGEWFRANRLL
jgi:nucleoside-diphosphate-sugar epimerase